MTENPQNRGRTARAATLALLFAIFLAGIAQAQETAGRLQLQLSDAKEITVMTDGQAVTRLEPVGESASGDILVYTIAYRNDSITAAAGAAVIGAIPPGTAFIPGSETMASGLTLTFSLNGAESFLAPPLTIPVKQPDGSILRQPAPPDMITHLRWELLQPVPPQATGQLRYKVKVK